MRLIDADDTLDTIEKYCGDYLIHDDQSFDKTAVRIAIKMAKTIDPIHAAKGCYCKECEYHENISYPNSKREIHDNEKCWCNWWDSTVSLNGFCSEGRKGKE